MIAVDYEPWRVVETRLDHQLRNESERVWALIGLRPMTSGEARQIAAMEMGRYAGVEPKRIFRAEPVTPAVDPDECAVCGHSLSKDHSGLARTCWHPLPDRWCQCVGGRPVLAHGGTPSWT